MKLRVAAAVAAVLVAASPAGAYRPDDPRSTDLFRYDPGEVVESHASAQGHFRVHYSRTGQNAVPLADADTNNVPDHVEEMAEIYEQVLGYYTGPLGYRAPRDDADLVTGNGGDARFDVYLLDFGGMADGAFRSEACDARRTCTGYMVQENDFAGYPYPTPTIGGRVLASHEFFHAVQAAYNAEQGSILGEGTAVWATERFDATLDDLEGFAGGYLSRPDRSLDKPLPGPVDAFSYGSALFFQFLDERFGPELIRALWETTSFEVGGTGAAWFPALDQLLRDHHQTSFADAYLEFVRWNLLTGRRADPRRSYRNGADYPLVRIDPETLPLQIASLRVFPAAAVYLRLAPGGRADVVASLVPPTGGAASLRLAVTKRRGNVVAEPQLATVAVPATGELRATIDARDAEEVIVVVVNTAQAGESAKPGLCLGDAAEVEACRRALGVMPDPPPDPEPQPGGCTAFGRAVAPPGPFLALALMVIWMLNRPSASRRQR